MGRLGPATGSSLNGRRPFRAPGAWEWEDVEGAVDMLARGSWAWENAEGGWEEAEEGAASALGRSKTHWLPAAMLSVVHFQPPSAPFSPGCLENDRDYIELDTDMLSLNR
jgi:hypothetical protein